MVWTFSRINEQPTPFSSAQVWATGLCVTPTIWDTVSISHYGRPYCVASLPPIQQLTAWVALPRQQSEAECFNWNVENAVSLMSSLTAILHSPCSGMKKTLQFTCMRGTHGLRSATQLLFFISNRYFKLLFIKLISQNKPKWDDDINTVKALTWFGVIGCFSLSLTLPFGVQCVVMFALSALLLFSNLPCH